MAEDSLHRIHRRYVHHEKAAAGVAGDFGADYSRRSWDEVDVTFMNRTRQPHNMHPHGCVMTRTAKGLSTFRLAREIACRRGTNSLIAVCHGGQRSGAGATEFDCVVYHGHVDPGVEINAGLLGRCRYRQGQSESGWVSERCGREFVTSFMVFDEMAGKPPGMFTRSTDSSSAIFRD